MVRLARPCTSAAVAGRLRSTYPKTGQGYNLDDLFSGTRSATHLISTLAFSGSVFTATQLHIREN